LMKKTRGQKSRNTVPLNITILGFSESFSSHA
jgi:hypothetical protein